MVFKITPTGLYIVNKGDRIEVMTKTEFNLYYTQNMWWLKAKKFLGLKKLPPVTLQSAPKAGPTEVQSNINRLVNPRGKATKTLKLKLASTGEPCSSPHRRPPRVGPKSLEATNRFCQ